VAEAKGCRDLRDVPGSKADISGTLVYHKTTYLVSCRLVAMPCLPVLPEKQRCISRICVS
jgi:hypothetical protein